MPILDADDPLAQAVVGAIRQGDAEALKRLIAEEPGLANSSIAAVGPRGVERRTLLHVATDWPGHLPNRRAVAELLIQAGADANAPFVGPHAETPLHWAASCDDIDLLDTLLDAGADIEARGGVIADGTPLADAVAFGQWKAARRLVERGARTTLWQAAALGLMDRVQGAFARGERPTLQDVTEAFWCACHGGRLPAAQYLLQQGADLKWSGRDGLTPLGTAMRSGAGEVVAWLRGQGAR